MVDPGQRHPQSEAARDFARRARSLVIWSVLGLALLVWAVLAAGSKPPTEEGMARPSARTAFARA
jgi:hypothetical protein